MILIPSLWIFSFLLLWSKLGDTHGHEGLCSKDNRWLHVGEKYFHINWESMNYDMAEKTCQGWNGHLLMLYPHSTLDDIKKQVLARSCNILHGFKAWLGLQILHDGIAGWIDGTKLNADKYAEYIDTKVNVSGCVSANTCNNGTWSVEDCVNTHRFVCESKDPCGVQAGMKVAEKDVWKNDTVSVIELEPTEVICLTRGYKTHEKIANVTLNCPGVFVESGNTSTTISVQFDLDTHGQKCVCSAKGFDGTESFFEFIVELMVGPRLPSMDSDVSSDNVNSTNGLDRGLELPLNGTNKLSDLLVTAESAERSVSVIEGESAVFNFTIVANPPPFKCEIKRESDGTLLKNYNLSIEKSNKPLHLNVTIRLFELKYRQTGIYRVVLENGIDSDLMLRLTLRVIGIVTEGIKSNRYGHHTMISQYDGMTVMTWVCVGLVLSVVSIFSVQSFCFVVTTDEAASVTGEDDDVEEDGDELEESQCETVSVHFTKSDPDKP